MSSTTDSRPWWVDVMPAPDRIPPVPINPRTGKPQGARPGTVWAGCGPKSPGDVRVLRNVAGYDVWLSAVRVAGVRLPMHRVDVVDTVDPNAGEGPARQLVAGDPVRALLAAAELVDLMLEDEHGPDELPSVPTAGELALRALLAELAGRKRAGQSIDLQWIAARGAELR